MREEIHRWTTTKEVYMTRYFITNGKSTRRRLRWKIPFHYFFPKQEPYRRLYKPTLPNPLNSPSNYHRPIPLPIIHSPLPQILYSISTFFTSTISLSNFGIVTINTPSSIFALIPSASTCAGFNLLPNLILRSKTPTLRSSSANVFKNSSSPGR